MSKRQSDLNGNVKTNAEMTLEPTMGKNRSKWDELFSKYPVEEIHDLHFNQRYTPSDLAKYTGIDRRALVQYYFYRFGLTPDKRRKNIPNEMKDKEWVLSRLKEGKSATDIAAMLDSNVNSIYWWIAKHDIDMVGERNNKSIINYKNGLLEREGELNPAWKGGKVIAKNDGYILIHKPDHPNAKKSDGYILEHRLVMSEMLNRPLHDWEIVHHKNGNKQDNRIQNLELRYRDNHPPLKDACCPNCGYEIRWD